MQELSYAMPFHIKIKMLNHYVTVCKQVVKE